MIPRQSEVDAMQEATRERTAAAAVHAGTPTALSRSTVRVQAGGDVRRRRLRATAAQLGYPVGLVLVLLALWQLVLPFTSVNRELVPVPSDIAVALVDNWSEILRHTWPTLFEILVGFAIAAAGGVLIAITISSLPIVRRTVEPLLVASLVVPKVALAPLFVIWFGFGYTPKIIIVVLVCFFPVVVDTTLGLSSVPREMRLLGRSMGASPLRFFLRVSLPYALPNLFVGLKVALALATVGAVVAEFVQSSQGLGYLLLFSNENLQTDLFFAVMLVFTALGVALYMLLEAVELVVLRSRRV
jgi:NitT/TauT family transport system permease protein